MTGALTAAGREVAGTTLRPHAEQLYADELAALAAVDDRPRPPGWRLSPQAVVTYLVGDATAGEQPVMLFRPSGVSAGTILLAEDDVRLAEVVGRGLADEYTVVIAHDGATALELVTKHQPQMLITDIDMPGINGIELSRRFRELTGDKLAPIIVLSAVLDLGTRMAGLEAGAVDYVTKPFDPLELRARIRSQFRMRDLAVRLRSGQQLPIELTLDSLAEHYKVFRDNLAETLYVCGRSVVGASETHFGRATLVAVADTPTDHLQLWEFREF